MAPEGKLGAGLGGTPSTIPGSAAGILEMTQWTQGCGLGASGSSTISASSRVSGGRPDHARGGERSSPSPVCRLGMTAPESNAGLFNRTDDMIVLQARVIPGPLYRVRGRVSGPHRETDFFIVINQPAGREHKGLRGRKRAPFPMREMTEPPPIWMVPPVQI